MYYVPDGTEQCGYYECKKCRSLEKNCTPKNVDLNKFANMMQVMKSGKDVDKNCPFCGAKVVLMKNDNGQIIGCSKCDMRINMEMN